MIHRPGMGAKGNARLRMALAITCLVMAGFQEMAVATVREAIDTNAYAVLKNGRALFLECQI